MTTAVDTFPDAVETVTTAVETLPDAVDSVPEAVETRPPTTAGGHCIMVTLDASAAMGMGYGCMPFTGSGGGEEGSAKEAAA